jgi:hypothetical protein
VLVFKSRFEFKSCLFELGKGIELELGKRKEEIQPLNLVFAAAQRCEVRRRPLSFLPASARSQPSPAGFGLVAARAHRRRLTLTAGPARQLLPRAPPRLRPSRGRARVEPRLGVRATGPLARGIPRPYLRRRRPLRHPIPSSCSPRPKP